LCHVILYRFNVALLKGVFVSIAVIISRDVPTMPRRRRLPVCAGRMWSQRQLRRECAVRVWPTWETLHVRV